MSIQELNDIATTSKDGKALQPILVSLLYGIEEKMQQMRTEIREEFRAELAGKEEIIASLQVDVVKLKKRVSKLEEKLRRQ